MSLAFRGVGEEKRHPMFDNSRIFLMYRLKMSDPPVVVYINDDINPCPTEQFALTDDLPDLICDACGNVVQGNTCHCEEM